MAEPGGKVMNEVIVVVVSRQEVIKTEVNEID